jgi:hypothetical protein
MSRRALARAACAIAAFGLAPGCAPDASPPARGDVIPTYNKDTGRLERITYDRNGDGRIDATAFMDGTRIVRAELDEDFDGLVDRWEYYATGDATKRVGGSDALNDGGVLTRVEQATGAPGKVSRWETYAAGTLTEATEDADGDGHVDKWEAWSGGSLISVALDTTGQGRPDRRLVYSAAGGEPRLELADSSGRFPPAPAH